MFPFSANEKIEDINGCPKNRSQMVSGTWLVSVYIKEVALPLNDSDRLGNSHTVSFTLRDYINKLNSYFQAAVFCFSLIFVGIY